MGGAADAASGVARAVVDMQLSTEALDAAAARRLGVNRTDLALLSHLDANGPMSPGQLAAVQRLTPASTTIAVQRLAAAGLVERSQDAADGRKAVVTMTDTARRLVHGVYGPLKAEGLALLSTYDQSQLNLILDFLTRSSELQRRHAARIEDGD